MSLIFTIAVPDVEDAKSLVKSTSVDCLEHRTIERVVVSKVDRSSEAKRVDDRKIDAESVVEIVSDALRVVNTTRVMMSVVLKKSVAVLTWAPEEVDVAESIVPTESFDERMNVTIDRVTKSVVLKLSDDSRANITTARIA